MAYWEARAAHALRQRITYSSGLVDAAMWPRPS